MPEMAGEFTLASLAAFLAVAGSCVLAFSVGLTAAARRLRPGTVWLGSGALVGGAFVVGFVRLYLQPLVFQELSLGYAAYFLAVLLGLPSAAATWVAVTRAARPMRWSFVADSLLAAVSFVLVLPMAAILASLPDFFSLVD